ncbi:MAG: hypothetical protein LBQ74_14180 [Prevotella sp.]|jgi:hypothetical protein|nr:hypothetical protein [Prevotella sp.]
MKPTTLKQALKKRLSTIEDAYSESGLPKVDFSVYPERLRVHRQASYEAIVIVEAARKIEREYGYGEIVWNNPEQNKYIPWFYMFPSGFAFGDSCYDDAIAAAGSGSRLHVLSVDASDRIGKTFVEVWEKVQLM